MHKIYFAADFFKSEFGTGERCFPGEITRPHQEIETCRQVAVFNRSFDKILRGAGRKRHTFIYTRAHSHVHTHRQASVTEAAARRGPRGKISSEAVRLDALERRVAIKTLIFRSIMYKPSRDGRHSPGKFWRPSSELAPDSWSVNLQHLQPLCRVKRVPRLTSGPTSSA